MGELQMGIVGLLIVIGLFRLLCTSAASVNEGI